jgi:hypothetical protein
LSAEEDGGSDAEECGGSVADECGGLKDELYLGSGSHMIKDEEENGEGTAEDCGSSELDESDASDDPTGGLSETTSDELLRSGIAKPEEESPTIS